MEKQAYTQQAPQLRNRLLLDESGQIDGVEGMQVQNIQPKQSTMESPTTSEETLEASGLEILTKVVGRKREEEDNRLGLLQELF
mmetsp:Transcript_36146/g.84494  ORF Transcript_36146/g.84494 Transcript_36146/m.84494 type:complete len:84 (+) Transcript_36146:1243-1494(+)